MVVGSLREVEAAADPEEDMRLLVVVGRHRAAVVVVGTSLVGWLVGRTETKREKMVNKEKY